MFHSKNIMEKVHTINLIQEYKSWRKAPKLVFSRDSDLTTPIENEDMLKKMRICINISSSFLTYPHLWSTISVYPHLF